VPPCSGHAAVCLDAPELAGVAQEVAVHVQVVLPQLDATARRHFELRGALDAFGIYGGRALGRWRRRASLRRDERRHKREDRRREADCGDRLPPRQAELHQIAIGTG
jgi:hypothetical protein